jgi:hypothetical protein
VHWRDTAAFAGVHCACTCAWGGTGWLAVQAAFVDVPTKHIGRVIGKKGSTIMAIEAQSSCNVDVPAECLPGTATRRVVIKGLVYICVISPALNLSARLPRAAARF